MAKKKPTKQVRKNQGKYAARSRTNRIGNFLIVVQLLASIILMVMLWMLGMLPARYLAMAAAILFFLWSFIIHTQAARKARGIAGKLLSLVLVATMFTGSFYLAQANNMLGLITGATTRTNSMVVAVLADDPAQTIEEAADYNFGVQFATEAANTQTAIENIEGELGSTIALTTYESVQGQAEALHNGEVNAILYNEAYTELLEEAFENYSSNVRIIYRHRVQIQLNTGSSGATDDTIMEQPFSVYISGIDVYGDVETTSRSDVNIIAVVNPTTQQILLITTPRDYYILLPGISNGQFDKLTHAGIYGIDASMEALGYLYETDINYYVRLNFTSLIDIVNILGGVDVDSEYAFTTSEDSGYVMDVQQGQNHFDGQQALAFSRERQNLDDGDNQRGKNQQAVITGMLKKVLSPAMLIRANSILDSVGQNVETNMSQEQINAIVKYQLDKGSTWYITSVAAEGYNSEGYCYSSGDELLSIVEQDPESVQHIVEMANIVEEGGVLEGAQALN